VFDPQTVPPPALPFPPAEHYVPAAKSLLARTVDRLPEVVDTGVAMLQRIELVFEQFSEGDIPSRLGATLDKVDRAVNDLRSVVGQVDRAALPQKTSAAIERLDKALASVGQVMASLDGLAASSQRATETVDRLGHRASGVTEDLDVTLRELGNAARAIHDLAEAIERDPDMLIKGRKAKTSR
jgi:paraquat-inducible protein B